MSADEFVALASNLHFLGDSTIKTQHFIGASKWTQESEERIVGYHQLRVAHQRYTDNSLQRVTIKGHAHGSATMIYTKVDGTWKFAGLTPNIRWYEYDYDRMFGAQEGHKSDAD
jgi:scytalone dehydratase